MTTDSLPDPAEQAPCDEFPELGIDILLLEAKFYIIVYDETDILNTAPVDCLFENDGSISENIFLIEQDNRNLVNDFTNLICGFIDCQCDYRLYPIIEYEQNVTNYTIVNDIFAYRFNLLNITQSDNPDYQGNLWIHVLSIPIYNIIDCVAAGYDITLSATILDRMCISIFLCVFFL